MSRWIRPLLAFCLVALLVAGRSAVADQRITPEMVVEALTAQSYDVKSVTRTLLGRVRIVAAQGLIWREVVLDLSSGQILRDYAVEFTPQDAPAIGQKTMPRGGKLIAGTKSDLGEE